MAKMQPKRWLSPTAIAKATGCLHSWYLECYGDPDEKVQPDAGTELLWQRGREHEQEMVSTIETVSPKWEMPKWEQGYKDTIELMKAGHPWIYQGVLIEGITRGLPDLLKKVEGKSALGNFTYIPVDIKNHKEVNKKDEFQLLTYSILLEPVIGTRPETGAIWLNTGNIEGVNLRKNYGKFSELIKHMEMVRSGGVETLGFSCSECDLCAWIAHCEKWWDEIRSTCLVRKVDESDAQILYDLGIRSYEQLAITNPEQLKDKLNWKEHKIENVLLHAKARVLGRPIPKAPIKLPKNVPIYFYDIETYSDCTYLHGVIRLEGDKREEKSFLAHDPSQEKEAWHSFLKYLSRDKKAVVYCWTFYERRFANSLWTTYGGDPDGWNLLSKNLRDQCKLVKDHFAFPVKTYGIKEVAPTLGFNWDAEDAGGQNSEMWYKQWLETGDETILNKIIRYNLDDVRAMEVIHKKLIDLVKD